MNPFSVNYENLNEVIDFAKIMSQGSQYTQYVVKYPERSNYNITMQIERALQGGATVVWQSAGMN